MFLCVWYGNTYYLLVFVIVSNIWFGMVMVVIWQKKESAGVLFEMNSLAPPTDSAYDN